MLEPWVRDYRTRSWKTYEVPLKSEDKPGLRKPQQFFNVCHSESEAARRIRDSPARFYVNEEMAAADIDPIYGCDGPYELAQGWRGHSAGTLVVQVCKGLDQDPPFWTYMIQIPQQTPGA